MQGRGDQDLRELVLGLQDQVAQLTEAVRDLSLQSPERWAVVEEEPVVTEAAVVRSSSSLNFGSPVRSSTVLRSPPRTPSSQYNSLAEEIPACPEFCLRVSTSLRGSAEENTSRARRAWEIGYWARFVLEGRIEVPRPSTSIRYANTIYVVLRAPGFECPLYLVRAGDYRHVVGDFTGPTLAHGFPSLVEGRIYCHGAGVPFPSQPFSRRCFSANLHCSYRNEEAWRFAGAEDRANINMLGANSSVGPRTNLTVPAERETDEGGRESVEDLEVTVFDLDGSMDGHFAPLASVPEDAQDLMMCFVEEDPSISPQSDGLLRFVKQWVEVQASGPGSLGYYSAAEVVDPEEKVPETLEVGGRNQQRIHLEEKSQKGSPLQFWQSRFKD